MRKRKKGTKISHNSKWSKIQKGSSSQMKMYLIRWIKMVTAVSNIPTAIIQLQSSNLLQYKQ